VFPTLAFLRGILLAIRRLLRNWAYAQVVAQAGAVQAQFALSSIANTLIQQPVAAGGGPDLAATGGDVRSRQVARAIEQVVGRAVPLAGAGAAARRGGLAQVLDTVFPIGGDERVSATPLRSSVALYSASANGASPDARAAAAAGLAGALPLPQALLVRRAGMIFDDFLRVLDGVEVLNPAADLDQVAALRSAIRGEVDELRAEYGRLTLRYVLADDTLNQLGRDLATFTALVPPNTPGFDSNREQLQTASIQLLTGYFVDLQANWQTYVAVRNQSSFSAQVSEGQQLLPILAESTANLERALAIAGLTDAASRSNAARLATLGGQALQPNALYGGLTVGDLTDWLEVYSRDRGPRELADNGLYGLQAIADEADRLFWPIVSVVYQVVQAGVVGGGGLAQYLGDLRVMREMLEICDQLNAIADLG